MGKKAEWPFHAKNSEYLREHGRMNTIGQVEAVYLQLRRICRVLLQVQYETCESSCLLSY